MLFAQIQAEVRALPCVNSVPDVGPAELIEALPYLSSALTETLRLRSTVTSVRRAMEDTVLSTKEHSVTIKKGRLVIAPIYALNTDPEVWDDPLIWQGDRFYGPEGVKRVSQMLAFGGGTSKCPGKSLAQAELFFATAALLLNFNIDASSMILMKDDKVIVGETFKIRDLGGKVLEARWPGIKQGIRSAKTDLL